MSAIGGIFGALWRFNRLMVSILIMEYALTFAIILSCASVFATRIAAINQVSGVNENGLYVLQGRGIREPLHLFELMNAKALFEGVAGRGNVAVGSGVPFYGENAMLMPAAVPDGGNDRTRGLQINIYEGDGDFAKVMGVAMLNGRSFHADEVVHHFGDRTNVTILSASLARHLFHGAEAVGRQIEIGGHAHTVIGVISPLAAPQDLGGELTTYTALLPKVSSSARLVVIRYEGPEVDLYPLLAKLRNQDKNTVSWSLWSYPDIHAAYFRSDRLAVISLAAVICIVSITALCGILGLTNYWISRRQAQIAIRRALGAKKMDIFFRFLVESGILVGLGLLLGLIFNLLLSRYLGIVNSVNSVAAWLISIALIFSVAVIVIHVSLRRLLRLTPADLIRLS